MKVIKKKNAYGQIKSDQLQDFNAANSHKMLSVNIN